MEQDYLIHRDQIHGDTRFDPLSAALLDTAAMQRLGRVYQLGYAHLVYRGGTHTRLSHVMGAAHMAGKLVDLLRTNYVSAGNYPEGAVPPNEFLPVSPTERLGEDDRWEILRYLVTWAALLHDIGHVPLGHTLEDEFDQMYVEHDYVTSPRIPFLWIEDSSGAPADIRKTLQTKDLYPTVFKNISPELVWQTVMVVCLYKEKQNKSFDTLLMDETQNSDTATKTAALERIATAYKTASDKGFFHPYMVDIVGNTICADYLDYLRRDPSNVGLDVLRDDRVAAMFFVGKRPKSNVHKEQFRMALTLRDRRGKNRLDVCTGVVELVRQRYRFAEIIYYHKAKVSASAMLAKSFALIEKPQEVPEANREVIEIRDVSALVHQDMEAEQPEKEATERRKNGLPTSLLDPEVGDETLHYILLQHGWDRYIENVKNRKQESAEEVLRGISLVQMIVRRQLYKICATIGADLYEKLHTGSTEGNAVNDAIGETLQWLRGDPEARHNLEQYMAKAADWPNDTLILYVPERKSRAKGIETGALDEGQVITLGDHGAVKDEVGRLTDKYRELWKIIILVHPSRRDDDVSLSYAIDKFVVHVWPDISLADGEKIKRLTEACRFNYVSINDRPAAEAYVEGCNGRTPNWGFFDDARRLAGGGICASDEHAQRATIMHLVDEKGGDSGEVKKRFQNTGDLAKCVEEMQDRIFPEGREGREEQARADSLDRIARDIVGDRAQQRSFNL